MKNPESNRYFRISRKILSVFILCILFLSFQNFIVIKPVEGDVKEDSEGNLLVDSGSKHEINMQGGVYQMQGNITVDGPGSKLTIRNTTLKFLKGYGFRYNINVKNSGTVLVENSEITIDLSAGGSVDSIDINVNSGTFEMHNSSLRVSGNFDTVSSNIIINTSEIKQQGGASSANSVILNFTSSDVLVKDSAVYDIKSSEHIYLRGWTNFSAVNSFLNLTSAHHLNLHDNATARLYSLSVQSPSSNNLISVKSNYANAEIFRLLTLTVKDSTNVPVGGAWITPRNYSNKNMVPPPHQDILDYFGITAGDYNKTNYRGKVILPLRSDNITSAGVDYTGNFYFDVEISTYSTSGAYSLKPYPNLMEQYNNPTLSISFSTQIPPEINQHYSKALPPIKPPTNVVWDSPLQLQQNLIIDGVTLTISSTTLEMNQSQSERNYILLKNGGKLIVDNSRLEDPAGWPLNIYARGASHIIFKKSTILLGDGIISLRGGSSLTINGTTMKGDINSKGPNNEVSIYDSTIASSGIVFYDTAVMYKDVTQSLSKITTEKVTFRAINTTYNKQLILKSGSVATLTNVTFPGVSSPTIKLLDSSEAHIYWWLTVRVVDGGANLLEKATVHLYNYSLSGKKLLYAEVVTGVSGLALFDVYSEKKNASGTFKGIERNYFVNASYGKAKSNGLGTLPLTSNKLMELEFNLAADLKLDSHWIEGNLFAGNHINLNASVSNIGDFDLNTTAIPVRFSIDGKALGSDELLDQLSVDETAMVSKTWTATLGTHIINITIDPLNIIGEKNESNNKATSILMISVKGPDIGVYSGDITFDPEVPNANSAMNISARITNYGGYDPADNGDQITVKFYLNDPDIGGQQIGNTQTIDSIPPTTSTTVSTNYTVQMVGNYNIYVVVETKYDSKLTNNKANRTLEIFTLPDLYISSSDIQFLPSSKIIQEAPVFIRATVTNIGGTSVSNVGVAFYDGDPDSGGSRIGFNTSVTPIAPNGGTVIVQIQWTPLILGDHQIFIVIDPDSLVSEARKTNNIANVTIEVLSKPNLYVRTEDIVFTSNPVMEGDPVSVQVIIHNDGEIDIQYVVVRITLNSLSNPALLPDIEIDNIPANGIRQIQFDWSSAVPNGTHSVYIWIDPDKKIPESSKLDNHAFRTLTITKTIDLRITESDILINNLTTMTVVPFGSEITITALIWNDGGAPTKTDFIVQFKLSDPSGDGDIQLGGDIEIQTIGAGEYAEVSVKWLANSSGNQIINVLVDPNNLIFDSNRNNNLAMREFRVLGPPDLAVAEGEIIFSTGDYVREGENVTISALIQNKGETDWGPFSVAFYDGDPEDTINGSEMIGIPYIVSHLESLNAKVVNISWEAEGEGVHEIYLIIDPSESVPDSDRRNNVVIGLIEVLKDAPDLTIESLVADTHEIFEGERLPIKVTISNLGNIYATNVFVTIYQSYLSGPENEISQLTFTNITAGSSQTQRYEWGGGVDGDYTLYFRVDTANLHKEFNERNNEMWLKIKVNPVSSPDFRIDAIETGEGPKYIVVEPSEVHVGESITFTINIKNFGDLDYNDSIEVKLYANGEEITSALIEGLAISEDEIVKLRWKPQLEGHYTIVIMIDPENEINEGSDSNNNAEVNLFVLEAKPEAEEDLFSKFTAFMIGVVIIVIIIAVIAIIIIAQKRVKEWAECSECGSPMPLDANSCPSCGAEFAEEMECGECNTMISVTDSKCPNCGAVFTEDMIDERKKKKMFSIFGGGKEEEETEEELPLSLKTVEEEEEKPAEEEKEKEKEKKEKKEKEEKGEDKKVEEAEGKPKEEEELEKEGVELDDEEFQEFERALDEELDEELEEDTEKTDIEPDEGEKKEVKELEAKAETPAPVPTPAGDTKIPTPIPTPVEDKKEEKDKSKEEKKEATKAEKTKEEKEDEEDKDDFLPGAQWTAECYKCNARIPLSASVCPECGAEFE